MPNLRPENLVKLASAYFNHEAANKQSSWIEIFKEAGIAFDNSNKCKYVKQLQDMYKRPFPSLNAKHRSDKQTKLPWGIDELEIGDFEGVFFTDPHFVPVYFMDASDSFYLLLEYIKIAAQKANKRKVPLVLICGGDAFDGSDINRHGPYGWEIKFTPQEEIEACDYYMGEIVKAAKGANQLILKWVWGNHDKRYDTYIATNAGKLDGMPETSLESKFPDWNFHMAMLIDGFIYVVHAIHSGVHSAYNNVKKVGSGIVVLTGDTHRMSDREVTFLKKEGIAVEGGTLAPIGSPSFQYLRATPADWQEGFVPISVDDGRFAYQKVRASRPYIDGEWWEVA